MADGVRTTHDIRIGDDHFLIRPGSYRKRPAPTFGARFTTGDPDYNTLSAWQHWAQTCWVGGFGAETWRDDAMFDEGVGVDASQHEVMVLARDLGPTYASRVSDNWDLNGESHIRIFEIYNDTLYCLQAGSSTTSRLYRFNDSGSGSWTLIKTFTEEVRWMARFGSYLVFGDAGTTLNRMNAAESFSTFAKPSGVTEVAYTLKSYNGHLYFGFGNEIWRLKADWTWDGSTAFYTAQGVTYVNQSEIHLGFLYFASRNGHILRTDGNNTFDLWAFEPHVTIWGIRSFDGRLFIAAAEELEGTNSQQTVLYQFSGAAVTELKRWGRVGYDTTPGKIRAFERKLFFGGGNLLGMGTVDGFGIAAYDPVEDAFHMFASNRDSITYAPGTEGVNLVVDDIMFYRGYLYCSVRNSGIFRTKWSYKDVTRYQANFDTTSSGASTAGLNGGWYTSSDFDGGTPGLLKLWNAVTVHVDLPSTACSVTVEYSIDGGENWTEAGVATKTGSTFRYSPTFILGSDDGIRATRMKLRVTLRTTDTTKTPQLRGVIVRYLPIPEPTWMWDMTLVLSESQLLHDGTTQAPDNATKLANLRAAFRQQNLVALEEPGGTEWASDGSPGVLIMAMDELLPTIGPSSDGALEYEVRLTLMEMVEAYES